MSENDEREPVRAEYKGGAYLHLTAPDERTPAIGEYILLKPSVYDKLINAYALQEVRAGRTTFVPIYCDCEDRSGDWFCREIPMHYVCNDCGGQIRNEDNS